MTKAPKKGAAAAAKKKLPPEAPASTWKVDDVIAYLYSIELGHVAESFRSNGVDGAMLKSLSVEDLTSELQLTGLQAKKVLGRLPK